MNIKKDKIFIQIKGIGFTFIQDNTRRHNLISPAFLAFFNFREKQTYSFSKNQMKEVNTKPNYDNSQPFLPEYMDAISNDDVFHYIGKKVGRSYDNRLRVCKVFMLEFDYEGQSFSFPFFLDKSLNVPAIIGQESFNQIKTVIKKKL